MSLTLTDLVLMELQPDFSLHIRYQKDQNEKDYEVLAKSFISLDTMIASGLYGVNPGGCEFKVDPKGQIRRNDSDTCAPMVLRVTLRCLIHKELLGESRELPRKHRRNE